MNKLVIILMSLFLLVGCATKNPEVEEERPAVEIAAEQAENSDGEVLLPNVLYKFGENGDFPAGSYSFTQTNNGFTYYIDEYKDINNGCEYISSGENLIRSHTDEPNFVSTEIVYFGENYTYQFSEEIEENGTSKNNLVKIIFIEEKDLSQVSLCQIAEMM